MSNAHDKISKLLNMTVENGCTEDEQETALRMAAGIAAREGIDLDKLRPKDAPKIKAKSKRFSQEFKPHQALCAQAAAELYGVEANVFDLGKYGFSFVGREQNIELAEQTMFWLFRQVEELYKAALPKGMTKTERSEFRKTFKAACAQRVYHRAIKLMREMQYNDTRAQEATGQNALVVQGHFTQLRTEINEYWQEQFKLTPEQEARIEARRLAEEARRNALTPEERAKEDAAAERERQREAKKAAKRKPRRERSIPVGNGTNAGYVAGDRVQLRKEVR